MFIVDYIKNRSHRPQFILEICGFILFCLLGGALVIVPALLFLIADFVIAACRHTPTVIRQTMDAPSNAIATARRNREESARQQVLAIEKSRLQEKATEAENRKLADRNDARAEVIRFYTQHAVLLQDALPQPLLRSQLQHRFPDGMATERAWQTAQEMISAMLPIISESRERRRVALEEERKRGEQVEEETRKQREAERRSQGISRLTQWYQREKANIEENLPDGPDRANILMGLFDRYDQLLKDTLREMTP